MNKIKYPIPFFMATAIYIGLWIFMFMEHSPESLLTDYFFARHLMRTCFFLYIGACIPCIEWGAGENRMSIYIAAGFILVGIVQVVMLIVGVQNGTYVAHEPPVFEELAAISYMWLL